MPSSYPSTLSPETWPFRLEYLPPPVYMVGGAVRDALLKRCSEYLDLDFVLPTGAVEVARQLARRYKAGFVLLDAQRQIARVVFPQATVDLAQQEGPTLETDLQRRDFTVNAIAYNPYTGELIDPLQGCADLEQGCLRMVSMANLQDDPLRLLRAYRQAAQLGFVIHPATQAAIRQLAPRLSRVAAERVRVELSYLLANAKGTPWLTAAWHDGLLGTCFNATLEQINQVAAVDKALMNLSETWPTLGMALAQCIRHPLKTTWLGIAKLTCLVTPKPEEAEVELTQLTYSRSEIKAVTTALKLLPQLQIKGVGPTHMTLGEQYFFFKSAGTVFPTIAILVVALGTPTETIAPFINRYLNPDDPVAHPIPLVTGQDLIQALHLPSSPIIGQLLNAIALSQIEGKISTPTEALQLAAQLAEGLRNQKLRKEKLQQ